ncbi:MAG: lipocalin family protein [Candidatus Rokuibacteriota bacterium]
MTSYPATRQTLSACAFVLALFASASGAFAQDPAKWIVGKWTGTAPSPAGQGRLDQNEYVFSDDGTFRAEIQSARAGLINATGTYKLDGDQATLRGTYSRGGRAFEVTLKRIEDDKAQTEQTSPLDNKMAIGSLSRVK